jgi:DHA1 family multidrug resistance protein-like MFS transporter
VTESESEAVVQGTEKQDHGPLFAPISVGGTDNGHEMRRSSTNRSHRSVALSRTSTQPYTRERFDVEQAIEAERTKSIVIAPTTTADGIVLVDWYSTDDPANPQNCE